MLFALLVLHAADGIVALVAERRLGRRAFALGALAPTSVLVWAAANAGRILDGDSVEEQLNWVPALGLTIDLRVDSFSLLMIVLLSGIGVLVYGYAWQYFGSSDLAGRVAGLLTLFAGSMLGVVLADNLLFLFVCWELTSVTSYVLIGADDTKPRGESGRVAGAASSPPSSKPSSPTTSPPQESRTPTSKARPSPHAESSPS